MKILLVHNFYRQSLIGGEDLVFNREAQDLKAVLGPNNVYQYNVGTDGANFMNILFNVFFSWKHFFTIYFLIKKNKIEIMHCHNFFPLLSTSVFIAAKLAGASTIHTLHNYRFGCVKGILFRNGNICTKCLDKPYAFDAIRYRCFTGSKVRSMIAVMAFWVFKKLKTFSYIDYFFVLTKFQQNFLIERKLFPAEKLVLKPNYINSYNLQSIDLQKDFDLIFVGRLEESKGSEYLLSLCRNNPDLRIAIVGTAPDYLPFEMVSFSNLQYFGKLTNEETISLIKRSKFLLQLSLYYETFGLTIIEAMSVGTPVLGFPIGTRNDFIIDGYNGFFLDPLNLQSGIDKSMLLNENEYSLLADNSITFASNFKGDKIIAEQAVIYRAIIDKKI